MNPESIDPAFDARMRDLHLASLQALPPQTLARLRAARHAAARADARSAPRRWGWLLAATPALLGAAFGLHLLLRPGPQPNAAAPIVAGAAAPATADPAAAMSAALNDDDAADGMLDENPDLYLWLGSETSLAME